MKNHLFTLLTFAFLLTGCGKNNQNHLKNHLPDWENNSAPPTDAMFQLVTSDVSGIDFENVFQENYDFNIISNTYLYNGGGVAVIDFNRDGLPDLFFTATQGSCKLYKNLGDLKFQDVTEQAKVAAPTGQKIGVAVADVNGDGWEDLYVCRSGLIANDLRRNLLFLNNQDGTFYEVARQWGVDDGAAHTTANFFDFDLDGDLDLYLLVHPTTFSTCNNMMLMKNADGSTTRQPLPQQASDTDRLLRNDGDKFTDVTQAAGIINRGYGLSVNIRDFNDDGYPDIYVGNDFIEPDFLYINNRNGTFTDRAPQFLRHMANHTMGVDIADLTNDGLPEIVSLDMLPEPYFLQQQRATTMQTQRYNALVANGFGHQPMRNVLQLNLGNAQFADYACLAGVFRTDWSWTPIAQDFDLDGWRDLYIANGYFRDVTNLDYIEFTTDSIRKIPGGLIPKNFPDIKTVLDLIPPFRIKDYFYKNNGDLTFEKVSTKWGISKPNYGNGAAVADLDNDGDLDLVVNNLFEKAFLYKNTAADRKLGNWLQIQLEGAPQNVRGIGAKIRATAPDGTIFSDELQPMRGYLSASQPIVQLGLGQIDKIEKLEVEFPNGKLATLQQVPVNQRVTVKISDARPGKLTPIISMSKVKMTEITGTRGIDFQHVEDPFNDFDREFLIPWQLSRPGPPLAVGDVNADGLPDFYVGGATGQAGALFLQQKIGSFSQHSTATWESSKAYEDSAAAFLDADADGDLDLVIGSGGNAQPVGSPLYHPRMYLNDGKGNFSRANDALPAISESCAVLLPFDADADGDLDLIFGGYCAPGQYPTAPKSYIFKNEKGKFTDATASFSDGFEKLGMIRAIELADVDGDNLPEILVAGEWMGVHIFKKTGNRWVDASAQFGMGSHLGCWRSLLTADFDGDGDMDIVAGNLGLNTRYRASEAAPLTIYAQDFDGNGSIDPIMCLKEYGQEKPLALKPLMLKQLPVLKKKFVRNEAYGLATVEDFFSRNILEKSIVLKINELAHLYFENRDGKMIARPLPNFAQIAPIHAMRATDLDGNGTLDIVSVGNDFGQQVETGRIDSGSGCILLGDGRGNFNPQFNRAVGFWANLDARSLASLRTTAGKNIWLVGNSGGRLQAFQ